jgi:biopolymer transport protein ExbD
MRMQRRESPPEIFTGSMADVTFLLIIYFMVTMAFSTTKGLDFAIPEDKKQQAQIEREESIFVQVEPDGSYRVDGRPLAIDMWPEYLKTKVDPGSSPPVISKPVILRPDPDAPYGAMMEAFDELRQMKDKLNLEKELNISLPTQREIENTWGALGVFLQ